jgi:4'-phosphopantetheinyl transferase
MRADPPIRFPVHAGDVPALDDDVHVWHLPGAGTRATEVGQSARRALDALLCAYAGIDCAPSIERGSQGKPFAPALPDLHFNLSHAGADVLLAFASGEPLGVDLERVDRRVAIDAIAARHFAPAEAAALARLAPEQRRTAFLHLWTRKEAVLKAIGAGLSYGLQRVAFDLDEYGAVGDLHGPLADEAAHGAWQVHALVPAAGLFGALAWRGATRHVRGFGLPLDGVATLRRARTSM